MKSKILGKQIDLRAFRESDAEDIYHHINDADVVRWTMSIPRPYSLKLGQKFIEKTERDWQNKKGYVFAIVLKNRDNVMGAVGIEEINWEHKNAEIAYWLGKEYWSKGMMSEAVNLALHFAFEELKLHRIYAYCFEENVASRRVLEKCGFAFEGTIREERFRYGKWHNAHMYSILEGERKKA